jgi:hypothetical protein
MIRAATALISAAVTLLAPAARAEPGWTCQYWCAPANICRQTCRITDAEGMTHVCTTTTYQYNWGIGNSTTTCT